jgi:hypothetical protein
MSDLSCLKNTAFTILFAIFGAPGIFRGDTGNLHGITALVWFISGPLSAIVAYKLETKPMVNLSVVIGAFSLFLSMTMHGSSHFQYLVEEK